MEKKSIKLQESKEMESFKPTALMRDFVENAVRMGSDNVAEIVRETSMAESTYYEWKKTEGFMDWMNTYALSLLKGDGWKLNAIGMKNAKRDHRYWESMQKIVGNIQESGTSIQNNNLIILPSDAIDKYTDNTITRGTVTNTQEQG